MTVASMVTALLVALLGACGCGGNSIIESGVETGPLRISPGSSAQFRERSTDNSLEEYGHDASDAELRQAATNVHAYLVAWAEKDWPRACALGSTKLHQILNGVFEFSGQPAGESCTKMIATIARGEAPIGDTTYEATEVDARGLRVEGNYGYLFFYSGSEGHQQEVFREGNAWKVKALLPSPLH